MLRCAACGCQLTKRLVAVDEGFEPPWDSWEDVPPVELIPEGRYWIAEDVVPLGNNIVINHRDAVELPLHPDVYRLSGCCGISGDGGINQLCPACSIPLATTVDDCWTGHYLHFEADKVELVV